VTDKVLFVDDEENVLQSIQRELRKRFNIQIAGSGALALEILKKDGPFAVIVSDMRMPLMDGIQLLAKVKDLYPDTVRLMLTGNADQDTAIEAVNKGQIFRFLNKPCPTSTLVTAIALALRQYRLVTAEKELLDKTLKGSVSVLSEILSLANPMAFSSGFRIKSMVVKLAEKLGLSNIWQYEIAALMSQIGCITLPSDILNKVYAGQPLEADEEDMFRGHPKIGAGLLEKIPRLAKIAGIIALQLTDFKELQMKVDADEEILMGAQLLKIAIDHDLQLYRGKNHHEAMRELYAARDRYDPEILAILDKLKIEEENERIVSVEVDDLQVGMIVEKNIMASNGVLITPKGQEITWPVLQGLKNFSRQVGVQEPVLVRTRYENVVNQGS
jgi:CheY-like chemotaxis protein